MNQAAGDPSVAMIDRFFVDCAPVSYIQFSGISRRWIMSYVVVPKVKMVRMIIHIVTLRVISLHWPTE